MGHEETNKEQQREAESATIDELLQEDPSLDPSRLIADMASPGRRRLTCNEYYMYILAQRMTLGILHMAGRLLQKFIVDAWIKIQGNTLDWLRYNQPSLRADTYSGLADFIDKACEHLGTRPGHIVILPSSFTVSVFRKKIE